MSNSPEPSIQQRLVRFDDMVPCKTAFIDARTPGSDKKENFCLIGAGVAENPDQIVHITIPHGFDMGAARQPKGCKNSHHSHDTEEVFVVHKGEWRFTWGECGEQGQIVLGEGDTISLPTKMFRGFENVGSDDGMIFSVLGLNEDGSAGNVVWAPYVYEEAAKYGLVLLEDGRLIDTASGGQIPKDGKPFDASRLGTTNYAARTAQDMEACVLRQSELHAAANGGLGSAQGVKELAVIGGTCKNEQIKAGKMSWPHRFCVRRLLLEEGASVAEHARSEEEVLIVQSGQLLIEVDGETLLMNKGDVFTAPLGSKRQFTNPTTELADIIVVRRGDEPATAVYT